MAKTSMKPNATAAPKRRPWIRRAFLVLAPTLGVFLALIAWFTRPAFLESKLVPWLEQELDASVSVDSIRLKPLSGVWIQNLAFESPDRARFGRLADLEVRFRPFAFLSGVVAIDRVLVDGLEATFTQAPSATVQSTAPSPSATENALPTATDPTWPHLQIRAVTVTNVLVSIRGSDASDQSYTNTLSGFSLSVDQFESGTPGALRLNATLESQRADQSARLNLDHGEHPLRFTVPPHGAPMTPSSLALTGAIEMRVEQADGALSGLAGLTATTQFSTEPQWAIESRLERADETLSLIRATAPAPTGAAQTPVSGSFSVDHHLLDMIGLPWGLRFADSAVEGAFDWSRDAAGGGSWTIDTEATQFSVQRGADRTPELGWSLHLRTTESRDGSWTVAQDDLSLDVQRNGRSFLNLKLLDDWTAPINRPNPWGSPPPLLLKVANADWRDWAFLAPEGRRSWRGILDATIEGRPSPDDGAIDLAVDFSARDLELGAPIPQSLQTGALSGTLNARVAPPPSQTTATLDTTLRDASGSELNLSGALTHAPDQRVDGTLTIKRSGRGGLAHSIALVGSSSLEPTSPVTLDLEVVLDPSPLAPENRMRLSGELPGTLSLSGPAIDTAPVMAGFKDLFSPPESSNEPQGSDTASSQSESVPNPYPATWTATVLNIDLGLLSHQDMALRDLKAQGVAQSDRIALDPIAFTLQGGPGSGAAELVWDDGAPRFSARLNAEKARAGTLLTALGRPLAQSYTGLLDLKLDAQGALIPDQPLHRQVQAQLTASLSESNLLLSGFWENQLLKPLAALLRVPELTRTPIDAASLELSLQDGVARIVDATVQSAIATFHTQGAAALADRLLDTPLSLPIEAKIDRDLLKRAGLEWLERQAPEGIATLAQLPQFIQIAGLLGNPQASLNSENLLNLALRARGGESAQLGALSELLEGVLGPSNSNAAAPGIDLQGLEGLLFPGVNTKPTESQTPGTAPDAGSTEPSNEADAALRLLDGFLRQIPR